MPHSVAFSATAQDDLDRIGNWIARNAGRGIARQYTDRIVAAGEALADFPGRGTQRAGGLRSIVFERRAILLYRVETDVVTILRVYHRGRNIPA